MAAKHAAVWRTRLHELRLALGAGLVAIVAVGVLTSLLCWDIGYLAWSQWAIWLIRPVVPEWTENGHGDTGQAVRTA